jgi:predicted signal transduction protein with EAL and GGDEF domain
MEGRISLSVVVSSVILIVVNGYFFNKSTEKLIRAYFAQKKAKESSEKLAKIFQSQEEELAKFYRLTVGRELRMAELKQQIKKMEETPGR